MAGDSAERNLLFGVLAVQLDFITRDQLVAATSQWVLNKQRTLREVFVEQKALTSDEALILDGVVQKHLERNGDDPRQSLQSIDVFDSVRATLGELDDHEIRSSVEFDTVGAAGDESAPAPSVDAEPSGTPDDHSYDTGGLPASRRTPKPAAADEHSTQAADIEPQATSQHRFTVLRMHQKGGLGRVSVALDEELNREIALKEILPTHADNEENRNRVEYERLQEVLSLNPIIRDTGELYVQADQHVSYGFVAQVLAIARQAGVENLGLVTDPRGEGPPTPARPTEAPTATE